MDDIDREMLEALHDERRSLLRRLRMIDGLIASNRRKVTTGPEQLTACGLANLLGVHRRRCAAGSAGTTGRLARHHGIGNCCQRSPPGGQRLRSAVVVNVRALVPVLRRPNHGGRIDRQSTPANGA